ncbi:MULTISPECIES: DUF6783 domain-containing protein [unclassified Ruminococcus]|uniref:DUF6783 domain-containing protein n=1 Tax=unclassified Ruminococcus TaxID=2608920 RepID=UPI00319E09C7
MCGRFRSDEGAVAGYGNRIRVKYTAKWGVQIAGMIFQTRSTPQNHSHNLHSQIVKPSSRQKQKGCNSPRIASFLF